MGVEVGAFCEKIRSMAKWPTVTRSNILFQNKESSKINKHVYQSDALRLSECLLRENLEEDQKVAREEAVLFNVAHAVNLYPGTKRKGRPKEYLW